MKDGTVMNQLFWGRQASVDSTLDKLQEAIYWHQEWFREIKMVGDMGRSFVIDEVAMIFPDWMTRNHFIRSSVASPHVTLFNSANDTVKTEPFGTEYDVSYDFLDTGRGWRIEAMVLGVGDSPVHVGFHTVNVNLVPVVHLSFKCEREEEYRKVVSPGGPLAMSAIHAQSCVSSYGEFSYWLPKKSSTRVYVKPRVNLRDGE